MSQRDDATLLSTQARYLCYFAPPSILISIYFASPLTALLSPLAFLPSVYFYRKWLSSSSQSQIRRNQVEPLIWTYASVGTVGLAGAMLVQVLIASATVAVLFGNGSAKIDFWEEFSRSSVDDLTADQLAHRAALAASWQNWAFNMVMTYIMAAFVEETLKYLPIVYARRCGKDSEVYIDYAIAGALSFGVVENLGFLYAACKGSHESWSKLTLTLFERVIGGSLGHLLAAALTALRAMRLEYDKENAMWLKVIGPSVVLHGSFDFVAMGASTLEGNVGWIHPTGVGLTTSMIAMVVGVLSVAVWMIRAELKALENR